MNHQQDTRTNRVSLLLRICAGAYLVYLAWDLRSAAFQGEQGLLYGVIVLAFFLIGAVLCGVSAKRFLTGDYYGAPVDAPEESPVDDFRPE